MFVIHFDERKISPDLEKSIGKLNGYVYSYSKLVRYHDGSGKPYHVLVSHIDGKNIHSFIKANIK